MKRFKLSLVFSILLLAGFAQSDKYTAVMQKNIAALDAAKSKADLQDVAASFERVGRCRKNTVAALLLCCIGANMDRLDARGKR